MHGSYLLLTHTHVLNKPICNIGSCVAQGFNGCCTERCCAVPDGGSLCFCDQMCHNYGDCCSDIEEAGCFPPGFTPTASSTVTPSSIELLPTPGMYVCGIYACTKSTYNNATLIRNSLPSDSMSYINIFSID